ncbi:MAG: hypothetical protein KGM47_07460 [Acidobacteriota bacterium]|nr:hypothetical protein [Acidobacteriota bacterium]
MMIMPLVYVFASSKMEAQPVLALAPKDAAGQQGRSVIVEAGGNQLVVVITGMGTGNARIKSDAVLGLSAPGAASGQPTAEKPDAVFLIGLCGGLTERLTENRIVAYVQCLSTEKSPPLQCSPALTDAIVETLQSRRITCERITGITSPRIAASKKEKLALARSGAAVVDMESYQVLSAAAHIGVPAVVLRVVADPMDTDMPDFNPALDTNGGLIGSKAIWIALGSPLETYHLLAANKRAMATLTPAVRLILQSSCFSNLKSPLRN